MKIAAILGVYAILMAGLVFLLFSSRDWALGHFSQPAEQANWETWREDVRQGLDPQAGSVNRRVPQSAEPPALVLMRDYFTVCFAAAIVFTTLLYAVSVWFVQGACEQHSGRDGFSS